VNKIERIMKVKLPRKTLPDFDYKIPKNESQPRSEKVPARKSSV
jgi:hypothetical protein